MHAKGYSTRGRRTRHFKGYVSDPFEHVILHSLQLYALCSDILTCKWRMQKVFRALGLCGPML